jgi:hypothetical protein
MKRALYIILCLFLASCAPTCSPHTNFRTDRHLYCRANKHRHAHGNAYGDSHRYANEYSNAY